MNAPPAPSFSAVLLAGGRSSRMGRDKALLPLPDGRLLWQRQLDVLRELGSAEVLFSGAPRAGFPTSDLRVVWDETPGLGPLAGIAAALRAMRTPLLLVLAIDLPAMTVGYLRGLLAASEQGRGMIPKREGFYEPMAAVYPEKCLALAESLLTGADRSLQTFARAAERDGLLRTLAVSAADAPLFANWNEPGAPSTSKGLPPTH